MTDPQSSRRPIDDSFLEQLKETADIVAVIGGKVKLKASGKNYTGLCPFHEDKNPSFSVNATEKFYHCFSCKAGGDTLKFIMETEGLDFYDAVHRLAEMQGVPVKYKEGSGGDYGKQAEENKAYHELLQFASDFYEAELQKHQPALKYLAERGIGSNLAKQYHLGYAPAANDALWCLLTDDKQKERALELALVKKNESGSHYDAMRDRVIFPIFDSRKRPVGFGGRVLTDGASKAKYLNSSDSKIFQKGQQLFGLPQALELRGKDGRDKERVLVVEGYMDVLALAGLESVVACLGTAFSAFHARLLFGRFPQVVFAFDGDAAGHKAANKAIQICLPLLEDKQELILKFLPAGQDPYDVVFQAQGGGAGLEAGAEAGGAATGADGLNTGAETRGTESAQAEGAATGGVQAGLDARTGAEIGTGGLEAGIEAARATWQALPESRLEDYLLQDFNTSMAPDKARVAMAELAEKLAEMNPRSSRRQLIKQKAEKLLGVELQIPEKTPEPPAYEHAPVSESAGNYGGQSKSQPGKWQGGQGGKWQGGTSGGGWKRSGSGWSGSANQGDAPPVKTKVNVTLEDKLIGQLLHYPRQASKALDEWREELTAFASPAGSKQAQRLLQILQAASMGTSHFYGFLAGKNISLNNLLAPENAKGNSAHKENLINETIAKLTAQIRKSELEHAISQGFSDMLPKQKQRPPKVQPSGAGTSVATDGEADQTQS